MAQRRKRLTQLWRSLGFKVALLLVIFISLPMIVYQEFVAADEDRMALVNRALTTEGELVANAIAPLLRDFGPEAAQTLSRRLDGMGSDRLGIKLLMRPTTVLGEEGFLFMASAPTGPMAELQAERLQLLRSGALKHLGDACEAEAPAMARLVNAVGDEEILTSLTPVLTRQACWVVIVTHAVDDLAGSGFDRPYWQSPEVRIATLIYFLMAVFVLAMFGDIWRNLRQFQRLARRIGDAGEGESFARMNRVPELQPVAEDFDFLVRRLKSSERLIRQAAEDNAHALKGPVAVISQALEPIRRLHAVLDDRARRSIDVIEQSIRRLDSLVSAARHMDETLAAALNPPRYPVDLSAVLNGLVEAYRQTWPRPGVALEVDIAPALTVLANEEVLEEIFENLLENALGFADIDGQIAIRAALRERQVALTVEDDGPGVPPERLERIFDRYYSDRSHGAPQAPGAAHDGIGLWIVRRDVEAVGGRVDAESCEPQGLKITVLLPRP